MDSLDSLDDLSPEQPLRVHLHEDAMTRAQAAHSHLEQQVEDLEQTLASNAVDDSGTGSRSSGGSTPTGSSDHQRQDGAVQASDYDSTIASTLNFFQTPFGKFFLVLAILLALLVGGGTAVGAVAHVGPMAAFFPSGGATSSLVVGTAATATLAPTATTGPAPTATQAAAAPTNTAVPPPPGTLSASVSDTLAHGCTGTDYPTFTLQNTGGQTLSWTATSDDASEVTIIPATGSLGAGAAKTVTLSGNAIKAQSVGSLKVTFTSYGGASSFTVQCGKP